MSGLSDPVVGPPTAFSPWSATLCWSPEQNFGRVSLLTGRTSLGTVWGRLEAGESPEEVAKDFGLQVSAVHVVDKLRREVEDARNDDVTRCGIEVHLLGLGTFPCVVEDQGGGHAGDCVTAPERDGTWSPARAVVERAIAWRGQWKSGSGNAAAVQLADAVERMQAGRPGADLVRAEHVSGVRVEAGPSSPLVSPGVRDDERGLRAKVSGLSAEPTVGDLGIAAGAGDEYRSAPEVWHLIQLYGAGSFGYLKMTATAADGRIHREDGRGDWEPFYDDEGGRPAWFRVSQEIAVSWSSDEDEQLTAGDELASAASAVARLVPEGAERFRVQRAVRAWDEAR